MEKLRNKVCGADVHKRFLVATILSRDGIKLKERFGMTLEDLFKFKIWIINNGCEEVAIESTGVYWIPVYFILEDSIDLKVANAYKIKHIPGRKTDSNDSEWLAELCLSGLIEPSRIFRKEARELRRLTRAREGLVRLRTQLKNRIHKELDSSCIRLSSVLSDIFGKSGIHILRGLMSGSDINEILAGVPSTRIKKKKDQIRDVIKNKLEGSQISLIETWLDMMKDVQKKIERIDAQIMFRIEEHKDDLEIVMSMPGMGLNSASTILAEIGNYRDFKSADKLASWCGLVPFVSQSGDKLYTGCITKHGSKHIRWMLVQVAHAITRKRNSTLQKFFYRVQAKKGTKVAIVALARKVLCILHHLLMKRELFVDEKSKKSKAIKPIHLPSIINLSLQDMIEIIGKAGYEVRNVKQDWG